MLDFTLMEANFLSCSWILTQSLLKSNGDLVEFSLQLSLTLMGSRSKEVQTLRQLLYIFLCWRTKLEAKRFWGSHAQPHVFSVPHFQGCTQSVQHFEKGYTSLLKQSELTSLLIQHNQSPDTSIFTLHPNSGSKVRRERGRRERERKRDQWGNTQPLVWDIGRHKKTVKGMTRGWWHSPKALCAWTLCEELGALHCTISPSGFTGIPNFCRKHKAMDLEIKVITLHKSNL